MALIAYIFVGIDNAQIARLVSNWVGFVQHIQIPGGSVRALSSALLFAATLCLVFLQLLSRRRTVGSDDRLANSLAGALRSGALEFEEGPRISVPLWKYAAEADEREEEEAAHQKEVNVSRYKLLAYNAPVEESQEKAVVTISYLGGGPNPDMPFRADEFSFGSNARRAQRDNPRESIFEQHVA